MAAVAADDELADVGVVVATALPTNSCDYAEELYYSTDCNRCVVLNGVGKWHRPCLAKIIIVCEHHHFRGPDSKLIRFHFRIKFNSLNIFYISIK